MSSTVVREAGDWIDTLGMLTTEVGAAVPGPIGAALRFFGRAGSIAGQLMAATGAGPDDVLRAWASALPARDRVDAEMDAELARRSGTPAPEVSPAPGQKLPPFLRRELDLGRVGYEGYAVATGGKTFDGRDMPAWEDLPERIRAAWRRAADRIAMVSAPEPAGG